MLLLKKGRAGAKTIVSPALCICTLQCGTRTGLSPYNDREANRENTAVFGGVRKNHALAEISREGGAKDGTEDVAVAITPIKSLVDNNSKEDLEKLVRAEVKNLSQRLAHYKRPVNIKICTEPLPRTATRKIQRNKVKEIIKH